MNKKEIKEKSMFINTLCGKYSNKIQSQIEPRLYAHINIYFRIVPFSLTDEISIYSEQSYDHSPWSPYRQAVHSVSTNGNKFLLKNYKIKNQERVAGAGFDFELLNIIQKENLSSRENCDMIFYKTNHNTYKGSLKTNSKHIIKRDGRQTYLVSKVEFNEKEFTSIDEGFDIKTGEKIWGAENGPLRFDKIVEPYNLINI